MPAQVISSVLHMSDGVPILEFPNPWYASSVQLCLQLPAQQSCIFSVLQYSNVGSVDQAAASVNVGLA